MTRMVRFTLPLAMLVAVMLACDGSEAPTIPSATPSQLVPRGALADAKAGSPAAPGRPDTVRVLKRTAGLGSGITASAVIGPAGGRLKLDAAGATFDVPRGALAAPTLITITAVAGGDVAYEFEPHGLTFAVPATLEQTLEDAWLARIPGLLGTIGGAYYEHDLGGEFVDAKRSVARVKETRPAVVDRHGRKVTIYINHFSGYLFSSGRSLAWDE